MKIRGFELVSNISGGVIPTRSTSQSAGYDFSLIEDVVINPGEVVLVSTGIKSYMNKDEVLKIYIRSSLALKKKICLANNVGIIDSDYYNNENNEGHIMIPLHNFGTDVINLEKGDKVAQSIFEKYLVIDSDDSTTTRTGGFGSTTL